jgi:hypothetical protein
MLYAPVGGSVMTQQSGGKSGDLRTVKIMPDFASKTTEKRSPTFSKTMGVNVDKHTDNTTMQIEKTFETVESPETLKEGQWYWNSWDGELFVVMDMEKGLSEAGDTVTVAYDNGDIELFNPAALKVDFERIHPVEVTY